MRDITFIYVYRFLTTSNLTTNEDIKGAYSNKRGHSNFNPFSAGNAILNCNEILCGPINPSLIDARGYVTEDYLISVTSPPVTQPQPEPQPQPGHPQPPQPQYPIQPKQQIENGDQQPPAPVDSTASAVSRLSNSSTAPDMRVSRLPPINKSNTAQNLTLTNVGLHNEGQENDKMDLDQTTMIGSALDLDSLGSNEDVESGNQVPRQNGSSSHAGSQVGLLKLSAV